MRQQHCSVWTGGKQSSVVELPKVQNVKIYALCQHNEPRELIFNNVVSNEVEIYTINTKSHNITEYCTGMSLTLKRLFVQGETSHFYLSIFYLSHHGEQEEDGEEAYLDSAGSESFCLRTRIEAAAHVGSCSSSIRRFSRLAEEEDEEDQAGLAAGLLAGAFVVTGVVEVEGDGSKPTKKRLC